MGFGARRFPEELPGFTGKEQWFLGLTALVIGVWGVLGVDFESAGLPAPSPPPEVAEAPVAPEAGVVAAAGRGRALFEANGCNSCHMLDGSEGIGPDLRGSWGSERAFEDGSTAVVDADYVAESILRPEARLVRGYEPAMPSYEGIVTAEDIEALTEYIRSLR